VVEQAVQQDGVSRLNRINNLLNNNGVGRIKPAYSISFKKYNIMALTDFILNGIIQMENTLGNPTFLWKTETFACIPNTLNDAIKNSTPVFDENTDFRMNVRLNQFTPNIYPELHDYITYQGYSMLVKQIKKPVHNVYWIYVCEAPGVG